MDEILEKMEAATEAEYEKILAKWGKIREDAEDEAAGISEEIYNDAMKCAAELMQVGAVCLRFINSNGKEWGR